MSRQPNGHGSVSCFSCQNRQRSEWCVLNEKELDQFSRSKSVREYSAGEFIYHEGDTSNGVYCLEDGLVGLRKYDVEGNATLVGIVGPGRTLGYRSFLVGGSHVTSAEAVRSCRVCFIDSKAVRDLIGQNPALGYQFLRRVAKDLGHATERYHQGLTLSVRDRFVHLLLLLNRKYGQVTEEGEMVIDLPLSRQDLAALVGTRPETLARTIRKLEEDGLAYFKGRQVVAPHAESLFSELDLQS